MDHQAVKEMTFREAKPSLPPDSLLNCEPLSQEIRSRGRMEKFLCIHGHFYQTPRENPWLEAVELQDSAAPQHDWNERITFECYAPNATARILDGGGRIERILSNYSKISFNFGSTLLAWMKDKVPDVHDAIVAADKLSQKRYSGHGSALAQVYGHMILPLANSRDKYTQVYWGVRDFEHRFGRPPEGMWLAETAADAGTLETLANLGIKFTILSPFQASRIRHLGKRTWRDVNGGRIDPIRPYLVRLSSGREITVFFYDAPVSQAVAFEGLLTSGERFAQRLMTAFDDNRRRDQLVNIATDGESYGHHHRYGEMALAYALQYIEGNQLARLTNYGEYLVKHPPLHEVQIHERSSWSCPHGVERWMSNCGCNSGGHSGWNQEWRTSLRHALDWLRDAMAPLFEAKAEELLHAPWGARDDYISVVLDRLPESREAFFARQASRPLSEEEKVTVLKLMELQRHAMLMYTSCGWFFDELSGIETVQVIQYAARVLQLAQELFNCDLEPAFLDRLERAKSNLPEHGDGRRIYHKFVKPAMIDWEKAVAHYAISSIFQSYPAKSTSFSFCFEDEERQLFSAGKTRLAVGRTRVISLITRESAVRSYAIFYIGEHNLTGGVRRFASAEAEDSMLHELKEAYDRADVLETLRLIDRHFGQSSYSLKSLFKDEQRRILHEILSSTREDLESRYRLITERYTPLMKFLNDLCVPLPSALRTAADLVLHVDIRRQFESEELDLEQLQSLLAEAVRRDGEVLDADLSYTIKNRMEQMMLRVFAQPDNVDCLRALQQVAAMVVPLPLGLNLWKVQNTYWEMSQIVMPEFCYRAEKGDPHAQDWVKDFQVLGEGLNFAVQRVLV